MKKKFLVIASLVAASTVATQSGTSNACDGHRRIYQACPTVTVVQPVVRSETVVVQPAPAAVVITPSIPAPAAIITPKAIKVPQASSLRLKANFLGQNPGRVFLFVNSLTLECEVIEWSPDYVNIRLPNAGVVKDTAGKIMIATQDGVLKRKVDVIVTPTPDVEVIPSDEFIAKPPTELISVN